MNLKEKIKNSIRAYIMGDALGVPYEFKRWRTFNCNTFSSGGYHGQESGVWSDDTSVLLCLIDAMSNHDYVTDQYDSFKLNMKKWFNRQSFAATKEGWFDIGNQTRTAILLNNMGRDCDETNSMGNGALFYALPVAVLMVADEFSDASVKRCFDFFCKYSHHNKNCFEFGSRFCLLIRKLLLDLPIESIDVGVYQNRGDVINTYNLVIDNFLAKKDQPSTLFADLCDIVNLGEDTDTNAALLGALMGTIKEVDLSDWIQIKNHEAIDSQIDAFISSIELWMK